MKHSKLLLALAAFVLGFAQLGAIDANVSFARFLSPSGAYIELHTHIAGGTVNWQPVPGTDSLQNAVVAMTLILKQGEQVVIADRFSLNSPSVKGKVDFVDLKRYAVEPGMEYSLELIIEDLRDPANTKSYKTLVSIDSWPETAAQSDIALLASLAESTNESNPFYRHGLEMEPLPHSFYGRGSNTLAYYNEIYATDSLPGERVLILTKIESLRNGTSKPIMAINKVMKQAMLIPHVQQLDISKLSSGNYLLAVEVRNESNELVCRREMPFYRSNPLVDKAEREELLATLDVNQVFVGKMNYDSLRYATLALLPLLPQSDIVSINGIMRDRNAEALRMYLYSFWVKESPFDPESGYRDFMAVADFVDREFNSGFRNGFESDRGYTYIKYGRPSDISRVETDPTAPPYEIWSYHVIEQTNQHNRRFIFYNPSLAGGSFELLHSDVIGERSNPQWELILYKNAPNEQPDNFHTGTRVEDNMGRNARRLLSDF